MGGATGRRAWFRIFSSPVKRTSWATFSWYDSAGQFPILQPPALYSLPDFTGVKWERAAKACKSLEGYDWIHVILHTVHWRNLMNKKLHLRIPQERRMQVSTWVERKVYDTTINVMQDSYPNLRPEWIKGKNCSEVMTGLIRPNMIKSYSLITKSSIKY
jgi:hypothetical protein